MTRQEMINEINELMKPALELGFDWPSTELGFTDPNTASDEELTDFLYELELFIGNKEQELSEGGI
jgi:hypothetical protein